MKCIYTTTLDKTNNLSIICFCFNHCVACSVCTQSDFKYEAKNEIYSLI